MTLDVIIVSLDLENLKIVTLPFFDFWRLKEHFSAMLFLSTLWLSSPWSIYFVYDWQNIEVFFKNSKLFKFAIPCPDPSDPGIKNFKSNDPGPMPEKSRCNCLKSGSNMDSKLVLYNEWSLYTRYKLYTLYRRVTVLNNPN